MKPAETLPSHLSRRRSRVRVPSLPSSKPLVTGTFSLSLSAWSSERSRDGRGWGRERVEALEDAPVRVREEVAVEVERDPNRRVAHLRLEVLRVRAGGDHQRGVGVTQVMEAQAGQTGAADSGAEDAVAEVVVIEQLAAR